MRFSFEKKCRCRSRFIKYSVCSAMISDEIKKATEYPLLKINSDSAILIEV